MKQQDIAVILVIVFISGVLSFVVSGLLIPAEAKQESVEVVQPITAEFKPPDAKYFNSKSKNPTATITIGDSKNTDPFNGE